MPEAEYFDAMGPRSYAVVDVIFDLRKQEPPGGDTRRRHEDPDLREHRYELAESPEFLANSVWILAVLGPPQIGGFDLALRPGEHRDGERRSGHDRERRLSRR